MEVFLIFIFIPFCRLCEKQHQLNIKQQIIVNYIHLILLHHSIVKELSKINKNYIQIKQNTHSKSNS